MDNKNKEPLTRNIEAYRKAYYEKHRDNYYTAVLTCELCGGQYKRPNKSHHYNTRRHKDLVELNNMKKKLFIIGFNKY